MATLRYNSNTTIIQSSSPHTGSTLLSNVLYGFFCPKRPINYKRTINRRCQLSKVVKTHSNKGFWKDIRNVIIVTSVRDGHPESFGKDDRNIVVVPYEVLLGTEVEIATRVYDILSKRVKGLPNRKRSINRGARRLKAMNIRYLEIQYRTFSFVDPFFHLHGSHRNR